MCLQVDGVSVDGKEIDVIFEALRGVEGTEVILFCPGIQECV